MIPECNTLAVSAKYHAYRRSWSALFHLWDNINEHRTHRLICPFSFQVDAVTGYRARKKLLYSLHIWIFELDRLKYKNCYFSTQQRKPSKSSHKVALHSFCFGRPLWSKEIGKSPLLVGTIVIEGWSLYFSLFEEHQWIIWFSCNSTFYNDGFFYNGHRSQKAGRTFIYSLSLKRVNYNTIYTLLYGLILSVSSKKNKVYTVKEK